MAAVTGTKSDPIPRVRFLDPRQPEDSRKAPTLNSVNIPLEELEARVAELPPKGEVIRVVGPDDVASETVQRLRTSGRKAIQIVKFSFGRNSGRGRLWEPNKSLWFYLTGMRVDGRAPGDALDLGCGGGRDAVYLAAHNYRVTAVDRLPDSLERGQALASHYLDSKGQQLIDWQCADVLDPAYDPGRQYDLITAFYFFDRGLMTRAKGWLKQRGTLIVEAFTTDHQQQTGKPASPDRVVKPGEMRQLLSDMEIIRIEEGETAKGHTCKVTAMKL